MIVQFVGGGGFYGFRLDRLDVVGLGEPVHDPIESPDPLTVVDNTAWARNDPVDVELRCAAADEDRVVGWFRRATVSRDGDNVVLRMTVTHTEALVDRVLRFGGAVRVVSPAVVIALVRAQAEAFLGAAS